MIKKRTPFLILAATILLGVFLKNDFVRFLIGFELILYVAGILEVRYLAKHVEGELWTEQNTASRKIPFFLKVRVKNKSRLPVSEMFVRVAVRAFPDKEEVLLTGKLVLDAGEEGSVAFSMNSEYCGCLEARLERIMVQDHFGLFQMKWKGDPGMQKLIFLFPEESGNVDPQMGLEVVPEGEDGSDTRKESSGEEIVDIRTYQNGDLFKRVHWKLSARMNDLMVKEMGQTGEALYWLYLNLEEPERQKKRGAHRRDRKKWDVFFENTEALTLELVRAGQAFQAVWIDYERGRIEQYLVKDGKSRRKMMCALLHTDGYLPEKGIEIAKELPLYEMESEIIEISLQGNITGWSAGE